MNIFEKIKIRMKWKKGREKVLKRIDLIVRKSLLMRCPTEADQFIIWYKFICRAYRLTQIQKKIIERKWG